MDQWQAYPFGSERKGTVGASGEPMSDTAQNGQQEQPQAITARKQRKSIKSPEMKQAVIARALLGSNNTQIANELDIDRATVKNILSSAEIQHAVETGRSRAVSLIPRALDAVEYRITEKRDGNVALGILRGTQVLVNQQISQSTTNNFAVMIAQLKQAKTEVESEPINTSIVTADNV